MRAFHTPTRPRTSIRLAWHRRAGTTSPNVTGPPRSLFPEHSRSPGAPTEYDGGGSLGRRGTDHGGFPSCGARPGIRSAARPRGRWARGDLNPRRGWARSKDLRVAGVAVDTPLDPSSDVRAAEVEPTRGAAVGGIKTAGGGPRFRGVADPGAVDVGWSETYLSSPYR